ncbi:MAG TPA: AEC family transporter [Candidatus Ventrimonas merdavium]|nr:AEC family transporter [Candidatus Ventrimonas merdavium]
METQGLVDLQIMMFLLMGIGYFLRKWEIITMEGRRVLMDLIIDVILPCNIITAFQIPLDQEILAAGFQILLISLILQAFCSLISATCYRKVPKAQRMVLQYGTVCSNAGLLGNPVAEGLYGSLGLLYASIYLIPQRIVMWSAGVSYFTQCPSRKEVVKKVVTHPCIVAVGIGVVLMVSQIALPPFLQKTVSSLGGCTTAVSMVFIGAVIADAGVKDMVSRITVIYALIRLAAIPLAVLAGCLLAGVEPVAAGVSVVLAAMPAGSTTVVLAAKYHGDEKFATQCVVFTTLLSMAVLPVWCLLLNAVL